MFRLTTLLSLILTSCCLFAQSNFVSGPEGFWNGYLIRNGNSVQQFTVDFRLQGDSIIASCAIPDWVYYSPVESVVKREGDVLSFASDVGKITVLQDSAFAEMIGECGFGNVHMKKGLRPPRQRVIQDELTFDLGDIQTTGYAFHPDGEGPFPTVFIVQGRGCQEGLSWDRRPEVLVQYGLAVIVYDKRGSGSSGFPCEKNTMELLTADLVKMTKQVNALPFTGPIGYLGYSAGGWLAPRAAALSEVEIAFMATVVGPSTSVKQQQLDCARYYCRDIYGLGPEDTQKVLDYTELEFSEESNKKVYRKMMILLEEMEEKGWSDVLEADDIPSSPEALDNLWVRRNRYDPSEDLRFYKGPFLSVLGGDDFVVPWKENSARFHELFAAAGKQNYKVSVVPSANHGMEHGPEVRDLGYNSDLNRWYTYFKYDRVAAGAMDEFISFLRMYEFIP